jgi:hypothetical protein
MDNRLRERRALMGRIMRMAGPNGVAGGIMSTGEAWTVRSRTIPNPDYVAPEPTLKDVMSLRADGDTLYATLRDGTVMEVKQ